MKAYLEKNGQFAIKELRTFCKNTAPLLAIQGEKQVNKEEDARKVSELYWFCLGEGAWSCSDGVVEHGKSNAMKETRRRDYPLFAHLSALKYLSSGARKTNFLEI